MRAEWEAHTSRSGLLDAPTLRDGAIRLGAGTKIADVPDPCGEPPNIERVSALISAALGKVIDESGKSYLRGAFTALQKNLPPLAMTYFAHVGLGRLANPMEDAFRLHLADVLLKDGVAPTTIIDAVAEAALARSYNPNQPRVPAGNGDVSGQWVGGQDGAPQTAPAKAPTQGVQVADATDNWAQYLNPIGEAEAATSNRPQFNGSGPNLQHTAAVERAVAAYAARGFAIISDRAAAVSVPGFSSPRVYDFIARDPIDGFNFGVEVKTTLYDTIFFDPSQVDKDVAIYKGGGLMVTRNVPVTRVAYEAYCTGCSIFKLRTLYLGKKLRDAGIAIHENPAPGGNDAPI